jgi:hypothetical protein
MTMAMQLRLDPSASEPLLGLWATRTATPEVTFSGTAGRGASDDEVVWQVDLPEDAAVAADVLSSARQGLQRSVGRLEIVPDRLAGWLASADGNLLDHDAEIAFATDGEQPGRRVAPAVEGLRRLVGASAPTAWVETHCGDRLVARSRTTLSGAVSTVLREGEVRAIAQHQQTLALATATRIAALQTTAETVRTAVAIAARLSVPGGALFALPVAWRFIQRVVGSTGVEP